MGIFSWPRRRAADLAPGVPEARIREAVDYLVDRVNPRLRMVRRYRERLMPAVADAIRWGRALVADLPPFHEATSARWTDDPCLRAFFATAADIPAAFGRSQEIGTFFAQNPSTTDVFAVLGARIEERQVFGAALQGDAVQHDVAQTTISFTDHRAGILGADEEALRAEIRRRLFDELVLRILDRLAGSEAGRRQLAAERGVLASQLRALEAQGAGLGAALGDAPKAESKRRALKSELERREAKLGGSADVLADELDALAAALAAAPELIAVGRRHVRLTRTNVVATADVTEPADEVEFGTVSLRGGAPRAFLLVRFPRAGFRPQGLDFAAAARFVI